MSIGRWSELSACSVFQFSLLAMDALAAVMSGEVAD